MSALLPSGRAMLTGGLTSTTCGAERERPLVERRVTTPTHAPSPPGRGHWSRAAACSRSSKASLPAAPPAPPAQQQQRAQLVRQPQWCPWLRATKKKRARHEHEQQRRLPDVLRNSGGERSEGGGAVPDECHRSSAPQRVFRLRAASCAPAAPLGQRVPPYKRPRPAFRPVEHRCRPPAHSWARRWALACSSTATPCASCRCCAVRARLRSQRAANGPCAPTLSATAFVSVADPWEHVVAAGLGGMVGSYVVAWEVRVQRCAVGHPSPAIVRPSRKRTCSLACRSA